MGIRTKIKQTKDKAATKASELKTTYEEKDRVQQVKDFLKDHIPVEKILGTSPVLMIMVLGVARVLGLVGGWLWHGYGNPYYRIVGTELLWRVGILAVTIIVSFQFQYHDREESQAELWLRIKASARMTAFISLLCAALRCLSSVGSLRIILDAGIEETGFVVCCLLIGALASVITKAGDLKTLGCLGGVALLSLLHIGSNTWYVMLIQYGIAITFLVRAIIVCSAGMSKIKGQRWQAMKRKMPLVGILAVMLIVSIYSLPQGRSFEEITGVNRSRVASTDIFGTDESTIKTYTTARYIRPVLPVESGGTGSTFTFVDHSGRPLVKIAQMIGGDSVHVTLVGTGFTEGYKKITP